MASLVLMRCHPGAASLTVSPLVESLSPFTERATAADARGKSELSLAQPAGWTIFSKLVRTA